MVDLFNKFNDSGCLVPGKYTAWEETGGCAKNIDVHSHYL